MYLCKEYLDMKFPYNFLYDVGITSGTQEDIERLNSFISKLTDRDREIFFLRYKSLYTLDEILKKCDLTNHIVNSTISKLRHGFARYSLALNRTKFDFKDCKKSSLPNFIDKKYYDIDVYFLNLSSREYNSLTRYLYFTYKIKLINVGQILNMIFENPIDWDLKMVEKHEKIGGKTAYSILFKLYEKGCIDKKTFIYLVTENDRIVKVVDKNGKLV